jgi:hypothetical protein
MPRPRVSTSGRFEKAYGANHLDVAMTLGNLAALYWSQRKFAVEERLDRRALAIREKVLGANIPYREVLMWNTLPRN